MWHEMKATEIIIGVLWEKLTEINHFEDLSVDGIM
jgi:hypothetical protein